MRAIVLAGGLGERLRPYTASLPKPLMPVGEYPILEIIIRQLAKHGFKRITLAVNHQAELMRAFFGDGSRWDIEIDYSLETKRLGTMGPLRLISDLPDNFVVMNGDVLTDLDFASFYRNHIESDSIFTISGYGRQNKVDFGVLETGKNNELVGFSEKPTHEYTVSMGIYAMKREVLRYIPDDAAYGFDTLMHSLMADGEEVKIKQHDGLWLDIGRSDDYFKANEMWADIKDTI